MSPATPAAPPTEKRRAVFKRHKSNRDGRHGGDFSACPHPDCSLFATGPATPTDGEQKYRPDGWPLCPKCQADELMSNQVPARAYDALLCFVCRWTGWIPLSAVMAKALFARTAGPATPTPEGWQPTLIEARDWLQKQADECRISAEQIEGRIRVGRPFSGDKNVAAHNRKNQQFFQSKADAISSALASGPAVSPQLEKVEDDQSRVVSVPSDQPMGSTASDNEVK